MEGCACIVADERTFVTVDRDVGAVVDRGAVDGRDKSAC